MIVPPTINQPKIEDSKQEIVYNVQTFVKYPRCSEKISSCKQRLKVPGGWVLFTRTEEWEHTSQGILNKYIRQMQPLFIYDPNYTWRLEP